MVKLSKQYYYSKDNVRKVNCYHILLSKKVVESANIKEDDNLRVYEKAGKIIIEKAQNDN